MEFKYFLKIVNTLLNYPAIDFVSWSKTLYVRKSVAVDAFLYDLV